MEVGYVALSLGSVMPTPCDFGQLPFLSSFSSGLKRRSHDVTVLCANVVN